MKIKRNIYIACIVALAVFSSCSSRKNFVYLNDMNLAERYPIEDIHEATVHRDDRLSIVVSCKSPELALPFNVQGGAFRVEADGGITVGDNVSAVREKGYRVDKNGNIDFPILGQLHVEGLTLSAVKELIRNKIIAGNYIKDPLVSIEILNFRYTVLGAVGSNGTYSVDGDRVTLLEAIAKAGDLTSRARVDRVAVIRENNGTREMYMHDLRSKDIFESPCFYLQQNDIVYVEPRYKKKDTEDRTIQYGTLILSLVTAACSVLWYLK